MRLMSESTIIGLMHDDDDAMMTQNATAPTTDISEKKPSISSGLKYLVYAQKIGCQITEIR